MFRVFLWLLASLCLSACAIEPPAPPPAPIVQIVQAPPTVVHIKYPAPPSDRWPDDRRLSE